jgi:hypothetical protein
MAKCEVLDCSNQAKTSGKNRGGFCSRFCQKHYKRFMKYGTVDPQKRAREPLDKLFWLYVDKRGEEDCWLWTGAYGRNGYGRTGQKGNPDLRAHRVSFELTKGSIPEGLVVMHSCDNRGCVNPAHLSVGTRAENMHDMIAKGRAVHQQGAENPRSKLTEKDVLEIRATDIKNFAECARRYGVTAPTIAAAKFGLTWRHLK